MELTPPLIMDGDLRCELPRPDPASPESGQLTEALNVLQPEQVRAAHRVFQQAGAIMHRTHTRHANTLALAPLALEDRCEAINTTAAALLRDVIGYQAPMLGCIAQINAPQSPSLVQSQRAYSEQLVYLADTGITAILLEHFTCLKEALLLLRIARSVTDAPVLAQLQLDAEGRTAEGISCGQAARQLIDEGAEALGISCAHPSAQLPALAENLLALEKPVSIMPGLTPTLTPAEFAKLLVPLAEMGVTMLGGCCGISAAHIRALKEHLS